MGQITPWNTPALPPRMSAVGAGGEGGGYPWRVKVNPKTGARTVPESRPMDDADKP
jgi:hypothetical protein